MTLSQLRYRGHAPGTESQVVLCHGIGIELDFDSIGVELDFDNIGVELDFDNIGVELDSDNIGDELDFVTPAQAGAQCLS